MAPRNHVRTAASCPMKEWICLAAILLVGAIASSLPGIRPAFERGVRGLARWVRGRGVFGFATSPAAQFRLDLMRMLVALVGLWDASGLLFSPNSTIFTAHLINLVLFTLLLVGLATPVAAWLIVFSHTLWLMPALNSYYSLSTLTLQLIVLPLAVIPAGRRLSLDALILRRQGRPGGAWRRLYAYFGEADADRQTLALFASLVGFSCLCFTSCLNHLEDPPWQAGLINSLLLVSPVQNRDYSLFDGLSLVACYPRPLAGSPPMPCSSGNSSSCRWCCGSLPAGWRSSGDVLAVSA